MSLTNTITGTNSPDLLSGTAGDDIINGLLGDDTLKGGKGDDIISGGVGADSLSGGKGNDTLLADENDTLLSGGAGFDILKIRDTDGDNMVDIDMTTNVRGIEALVGDFDRVDGSVTNATINLNQILGQSQDDSDAGTPDTDNTFIAVGIDSLIIAGGRLWEEDGDFAVVAVDLDASAEAAYLEMVGIQYSVDLHSYTFTKDGGEEVTIITDLALEDIIDGNTGADLGADIPS